VLRTYVDAHGIHGRLVAHAPYDVLIAHFSVPGSA